MPAASSASEKSKEERQGWASSGWRAEDAFDTVGEETCAAGKLEQDFSLNAARGEDGGRAEHLDSGVFCSLLWNGKSDGVTACG
jgi:hypothetical protein